MPRRKGSSNKPKLGAVGVKKGGVRKDYDEHHGIISNAYLDLAKELGGRMPTIMQVADRTGFAPNTVHSHLQNLEFNPRKHPVRIFSDEVAMGIARSAIAGSSASQKLYYQLFEGFTEKSEVNGNLNISGKIDLTVEYGVRDPLAAEVLGKLALYEIVIARVAFKRGLNSHYILNRLRNSIYAKQSGLDAPDNDLNDLPQYPSVAAYNFDMIEKLHKERQIEFKKEKEIIDIIPVEDEKKVQDSRKKLLALLERDTKEFKQKRKEG